MKKAFLKVLLIALGWGIIGFCIPAPSHALEAIKFGESGEWNLYGFIRNNSGIFTAKNPIFQENGNQWATERTWLRIYSEVKPSLSFRVFTALQFIHEPWYPYEEGAGSSRQGKYSQPVLHEGHEYSEWNDINDVLREAWFEWKPTRTTTFKVGRQIAIWGEAMTTRVSDVIQPEDTRFNFAFANLEDTRIPQWMVRATHTFPSIFTSFEWIVNPTLTRGDYSVNRGASGSIAGSPGQRFGLLPNTEMSGQNPAIDSIVWNDVPLAVFIANPFLRPDTLGLAKAIGNAALLGDSRVVFNNPISRDWYFEPLAPFGNHWLGLYQPFISHEYPHGWDSTRGGFRTQTTMSNTTFGFSYFHTQTYNPALSRDEILVRPAPLAIDIPGVGPLVVGFTTPGYRQYTLKHPNIDIFGFQGNHVFPCMAGVWRWDVIYIPNQVFPSMAYRDQDGLTRRDYAKYMIGYDLNSFFYFAWHKDAPFDMTIEHVGEFIPNNTHVQYIAPFNESEQKKWNPSFSGRLTTSWFYKLMNTDLIVAYIPWGNSGFIMPSVGFTPAWLNGRLSFNLQYINLFGEKPTEGLGIFRDKSMLVFTSQLDW